MFFTTLVSLILFSFHILWGGTASAWYFAVLGCFSFLGVLVVQRNLGGKETLEKEISRLEHWELIDNKIRFKAFLLLLAKYVGLVGIAMMNSSLLYVLYAGILNVFNKS